MKWEADPQKDERGNGSPYGVLRVSAQGTNSTGRGMKKEYSLEKLEKQYGTALQTSRSRAQGSPDVHNERNVVSA